MGQCIVECALLTGTWSAKGIMASGNVNREKQAEHMAQPHRFCDVKIFLANSEPSTHGPSGSQLLQSPEMIFNVALMRGHQSLELKMSR